ncbi:MULTISPECIES: sugar phosphate isomerase/epimerase family protein [Burkholderiaceae]|uniref:sugar phosphate isomerase/epimerase family protein n=1 Tax=Burkholderiaceae TaxID=119060 RepID=UPI00141EB7FD|nr:MULTISPECIES: sugar phosphate isomerase/epimerase family protein [Burkholderiaceae]MBN3846599.1 sugar phosphate isomerase/epimerase [Paraburkholderia sp. Ac-20342]NIF55684.1 sugar phosphate isomerase/epimerase [Burkholderia sp. Ax-1724]NIF78007.1 sugar phosphate isomerase/epimerase [Paraburkholderia sp. Cy-641]
MKLLGAHTFGTVWTHDAAGAIAAFSELGFRDFQLMAMAPHLDPWTWQAALPPLQRALDACGARVIAVDLPSSDINIASSTPAAVEFAMATYEQAMSLAHAVNAKWLTINSGRKHMLLPPPDERLLQVYSQALERLAHRAGELGMRILIENIPGCLLDTAAALAQFLDRHDFGNVDVLYDVANAAAIGEDPVDGLALLSPRVAVVHLSDAGKGKWQHAPIGSGDIDFEAIRRQLADMQFAGDVVLEIISARPIEDLRASLERLRAQGW